MLERLENLVKFVNCLHQEELNPVKRITNIEIDHKTFDNDNTRSARAMAMGDFYENITAGFYGGSLNGRIILKNGDNSKTIINTDIYHSERKIMYEVKASQSGHHIILLDRQINNYKLYQLKIR